MRKIDKRGHWLESEIVRREARMLALQHRYFSPECFAEFEDFLHRGSQPYPGHFLEEPCTMVFGTQTYDYCLTQGGPYSRFDGNRLKLLHDAIDSKD